MIYLKIFQPVIQIRQDNELCEGYVVKKFIPVLIVLIIAFGVWALLGFPRDFDSVSTKILSVLTLLGTIFTVSKGIKEAFFDKPSKTLIEELFDQSHPLKVQLVDPKKEVVLPTARVDGLKKIRGLPLTVNRDQVAVDVAKILGDRSDSFWKEIDTNQSGTLLTLAKNPFWLEGLVLVFEQNNGAFPKNDARLLTQVLLNQWTEDKLNVKKTLSLDTFQRQLGWLAYLDYPDMEFPESSRRGHIPNYHRSIYSPYERLIMSIGKRIPSEKDGFVRRFLIFFFKDPDIFFRRLDNLKEPWKTISLLPFYILATLPILLNPLNLLGYLFSVLRWPFVMIDRMIERYVTRVSSNQKSYELWEQYNKSKANMRRFLDKFNLRRVQNVRRGELILKCAQQAGILESDGKQIKFTQEFWRDYFTAFHIVKYNADSDFFRKRRSQNWKRLYEGENVAVMICGLYPSPVDMVEKVLTFDPVTAANCFITLENIPRDTLDILKKKILDMLVNDLRDAPKDGNSMFCFDSICAIRSLTDSAYCAKVSLEKIPEIEIDQVRIRAIQVFATYGKQVFDMLASELEHADINEQKYYLIALGELKDRRAIPVLKKLFNNTSENLSKVWAVVILGIYFEDPDGIASLEKYLCFESERGNRDRDLGRIAWSYFDFRGEQSFEFALGVLERASNNIEGRTVVGMQLGDVWHSMDELFISRIKYLEVEQKIAVEKMLLDALSRATNNPRMTHLLIKAFGEMKSQAAIPVLIPFVHDRDDYVRELAVSSLVKIDRKRLGIELIGLLYGANLYLIRKTIDALGDLNSIDAIPALVEILDSEGVDKDGYEGDDGFPIALSAVDALIKIGTGIGGEKNPPPDRKEARTFCFNTAAEWCRAHLDDKRPIRNYRTVSHRVLNYLDHEIPMEKAHQYYSDWVAEHPDERWDS